MDAFVSNSLCPCFEGKCVKIILSIASIIWSIILIAAFVALIGLKISDIVVASKWDDCHLENVDIYLYTAGATGLATLLFLYLASKSDDDPFKKLATLSCLGHYGVIIWGTTILYYSDVGDCTERYYDYAYYRTLVVVFIVPAILLCYLVSSAIGCCCAKCAVGSSISVIIPPGPFADNLQKHFDTKKSENSSIV